ncbi:LpqB family beta-propeller domain-containing protein [Demequina pelophila]|uniref:LpqB family beta-propeller domain-containing protein n=1 Tax=Demequina pelophila TaxID=1638984 RepID=UPI0007840A24|nr:LpqB family beta-propeller domain-containing protein [Demequina pelophila]
MRTRLAALAALVALALGACAAIPTEGPVTEGGVEIEGAEPFVPFAEGPRKGDTITGIVDGFIRAVAAGFASDFTVARQYLTEEASAEWDPTGQVTVFDSGALTPDVDESAGTVTYTVPVAATVDGAGRLTEADSGSQTQLRFDVVQNEAGQWRIDGLADGTLLAEATFNRVFVPVSLVFATVDRATAVPELRWLPSSNVATYATQELIAGPSPWLANAVATGFAPGATLALDSVVVTDGVARVVLASQAIATPEDRALAAEQLTLTLTALAGIREVDVTSGGLPVDAGDLTLARQPVPESIAAAFAGGRLGLWDGADLWVTPDDAGGLPDGADALAVSYDANRVAFRVDGRTIVESDALAGGVDSLVAHDPTAPAPEGVLETRVLAQGESLTPPSFDREGWLWTAESDGPSEVLAIDPDGESVVLDARWLAGRTRPALVPSRDAARLLVVSQSGAQTVVEVAEIVRTADGTPVSVGEPLVIGANLGAVVDASWVDDSTVALLGVANGEDATPLWLVTVGGRTIDDAAVPDAVSLAARHGDRSITLVSADGSVRERAGTGWSGIASGIDDLAYAG